MSWLKLIILLCVVIATHVAFISYWTGSVAKILAPKFTSLTAAEESQFQISFKEYKNQLESEAMEKCKGFPKVLEWSGQYGFDECVRLSTHSKWLMHPKEVHKFEVIDPIEQKIQDQYHAWFFGIFYIVISFQMLKLLWKWMQAIAIPVFKNQTQNLKSRVNDESSLWANRKMSTAVKQLDDLDNLFERGMITNDVLQKRKAEIKKALSQ